MSTKKYTTLGGEEVTYRVCSSLQQLMTKLLKRAGIKGGSSHSGRRTFATRLADRGVDEGFIQTVLGHSDLTLTIDYIEPNSRQIRCAMAGLYVGL